MVESDFSKNSAAHHHGKHHGNTLTDVSPDDADVHGQEPTHENDEHSQHHEETTEKERNKKMSTRSKSTFTNLIVAVTFALTLAGSAVAFDGNNFRSRFQDNFDNNFNTRNFDARFSNDFNNSFAAADFNNRFDSRFENNFNNSFALADFNNDFSNNFENNRFDRSLA